MTVTFEITPNPLTRKFSSGLTFTTTPYDATALSSAKPLLDIGITSVFVGRDHLALSIPSDVDWESVTERAMWVIEAFGDGFVSTDNETQTEAVLHDDPVVRRIIEILDVNIRPAVAHDGGDVTFVAFDDGVLVLEMAGACSGCPSSTATLKMGILNMMQYFVPEVRDVVAASQ